jgi:hypothetical protein
MRGPLHAAGIAGLFGSLALLLPPLACLSGAAVGLVALRWSVREVLIVVAGAALFIALVIGATKLVGVSVGRPGLVFPLLLTVWLLICVCAWVLRVTQSQGLVLLTIGTLAALFALGMRVVTGDVVAWWQQWWVAQNIDAFTGVTVDEVARQGGFAIMNGVTAVILIVNLMLTILLARWWQAILYKPGGFRAEFHALRLPRVLVLPIIVLGGLIFGGFVRTGALTDLFMVAVIMYLFQGLAVMHGVVGGRGLSPWLLVPIYAGLLLVPPFVIQGLALLGVVDSIIDFRGRGGQRGT